MAGNSGLTIDNGIVCDETCQAARIVAAGMLRDGPTSFWRTNARRALG